MARRTPVHPEPVPAPRQASGDHHRREPPLTPEERAALGAAARARVPLASHADLGPEVEGRDPVARLEEQGASRVTDLLPIRYGRMLASPFTFFRGAAAVMAADLSGTPVSGLQVQACGDAHLENFGMFASPERLLLFDVNDFDETHRGPWEWDVKRLAASLAVAGHENGFDRKHSRKVVRATVRRYREAMARFATMRHLDVWYASADLDTTGPQLAAQLHTARRRDPGKAFDKAEAKARTHDSWQAAEKLTTGSGGRRRFVADPPLVVPVADLVADLDRERLETTLHTLLARYRRTLSFDRRVLLEQFEVDDLARKVVGVGSVGTRCWVVLLHGRDHSDPLVLQVKEAQASVLAPYVPVGTERFRDEGERVVCGQRVMQAASDIFLGWERAEGVDGRTRDFYVRQLRDWKGSALVDTMSPAELRWYGELCGWSLSRAHARSGDRVAVAAYLGEDDTFDEAVADYAEAYAARNERDHAALTQAARSGRVPVLTGV